MITQNETEHKIILFDGVCNFCNYWVNFVIVMDKKDRFRFASLQSEKGQELLSKYNLPHNDFDSFILISRNKIKSKSLAVFEIARDLGGWIRIINLFSFLPAIITNSVYDLVAKYRYKIFGKRNVCRIPTEEEKTKFL